jgi:hypothetical protein
MADQKTHIARKNEDIEAAALSATSVTTPTVTATTGLVADTISERTAAAGVTADSVLLKDGIVHGRTPVVVASADGAISIPAYDQTIVITKAGVCAMTLAAPTPGTHDGVTLTFVSTTAQAHTLTHTEGFGGGTTARDVGTWGGAINDGMEIVAYNGVWYIKYLRNVTVA